MNALLLLSIRENSTFDFNYFSGGLPDVFSKINGGDNKIVETLNII